MNIAFRADASTGIGSGHVMRCLTLANKFRNAGFDVTFVSRNLNGHLGVPIVNQGFSLKLLAPVSSRDIVADNEWLSVPWEIDVEDTRLALGRKVDWLIIDHYGIDSNWHVSARSFADSTMVIDDLADRSLSCDVVLDQTLQREPEDYFSLVDDETKFLCGSSYALVRNEFRDKRNASLIKKEKFSGIRRILISFGGADVLNFSELTIRAILNCKLKFHLEGVDVVLGHSSPYKQRLMALKSVAPFPINLIDYTENMASLMLDADIAIGAGGSSSWERCTVGLPTILCVVAENQRMIAEKLSAAGAAITVKHSERFEFDLGEALEEIDANADYYRQMSASASLVCDGLGAERVASFLF